MAWQSHIRDMAERELSIEDLADIAERAEADLLTERELENPNIQLLLQMINQPEYFNNSNEVVKNH
jgi:hypothetical protein